MYLNRVTVRMNDRLRAITFSSTYQNVSNLYKNFKLLKLQDLYRLESAKFMYKLEHSKLPKLFNSNLVKITNHHKYGTRQATSSNYFLPRVGKKMHRTNSFLEDQNYGVQLIFILKINNGIHLRSNVFSS